MQGYHTTGLGSRLTGVFLVALGAMSLGACGALSPFNNRLGAGYTAVVTAREGALQLLEARSITPDQAQKVQDKADQIRGALDLAASIRATDPGRAAGILPRVTSALLRIENCTQLERADLSNCIDRVEVPR